MNKKVEFITIPIEEYKKLQEYTHKLSCLESCGVDNWSGYGEAMEMYNENYKEEEEDDETNMH